MGRAEFTMPSLGADMDEGTVLEWLVKPGDQVHKGDIVAVVDTAKAAVEVECFDEGVIESLLVEPGRQVAVGTPLAVIGPVPAGAGAEGRAEARPQAAAPPASAEPTTEAGPPPPIATPEAAPSPPRPRVPPPAAAPSRPAAVPPPQPAPEAAPERAPKPAVPPQAVPAAASGEPHPAAEPRVSSPLVRHFAEEQGVDLTTVRGTGRSGAITRADVERAVAARERAGPGGERPERPARPRVSPLARRLAAELGVDLTELTGTGAQGAVRAEDVRHAAAARIATPARPSAGNGAAGVRGPGERAAAGANGGAAAAANGRAGTAAGNGRGGTAADRQAAMRQAIARLMARSKREIPHYYLTTTVDLAAATAWLRERNRELPVSGRLLPAALLLKATALAAKAVPELNGFWIDDAFVPGEAVNLGVAVSLRGGGLVTPAVHDAASLGLDELMARLKDLGTRARSGRLKGSELTGGTITVTNLGDQGVESVTGVIFPPQVALVGIGKVVERPWAVNGLLGVRPLVTVTLAADHRATDGYTGARFLDTVARLLQAPEEL